MEYAHLLEPDPNLKRWYTNLSKASQLSADIYLRRFGSFCREVNITPAQFAKLSLRKRIGGVWAYW
jgi:hypothetical protein